MLQIVVSAVDVHKLTVCRPRNITSEIIKIIEISSDDQHELVGTEATDPATGVNEAILHADAPNVEYHLGLSKDEDELVEEKEVDIEDRFCRRSCTRYGR